MGGRAGPVRRQALGWVSTVNEHWHSYWATQRSAGHTIDSEAYYREHGAELRALFPSAPANVLDLGCGDGALFAPLGFDGVARYRGVDFSQSMLDEFVRAWPTVDVVRADASAYRDAETYDLVFSNQVVQYFNPAMFRSHLANVRAMLADGGVYVCGGIPWRDRRAGFVSGRVFPPYRASMTRLVRDRVRALAGRPDGIGQWYRLAELAAMASGAGFSSRFVGAFQLYRVHAVFTPTGG